MNDAIEKEVQARVEFKMNELLTAITNRANTAWHVAFDSGSAKHAHYWEAFNQLGEMLFKEIHMPVPFDDMAERSRRHKRDAAIEKVMSRFCKRGERDFHQKEKFLVGIIEELQKA